MQTHADKTLENKRESGSTTVSQKINGSSPTFQFVDNRPEAIAQRKIQEGIKNSPQAKESARIQNMANVHSALQRQQLFQKKEIVNADTIQTKEGNSSIQFAGSGSSTAPSENPIQKKENNTGLPDNLKTGMENLSGMSLNDVKVHRNSDKPAQLNAHAYAQGTDIHLGSGQEKHLPHEAWHVVQQKQGRVKPTMQMKGKVNVNDDIGLEKEADVMGAKALQTKSNNTEITQKNKTYLTEITTQRKSLGALKNSFLVNQSPIQLFGREGEFMDEERLKAHYQKHCIEGNNSGGAYANESEYEAAAMEIVSTIEGKPNKGGGLSYYKDSTNQLVTVTKVAGGFIQTLYVRPKDEYLAGLK